MLGMSGAGNPETQMNGAGDFHLPIRVCDQGLV